MTAPLPFDAHRVRAALGETTGIKGDDAIGCTQLIDHLSDQYRDQRAVVPGRDADEVLDDLSIDIDQGGDVLGVLALQMG